tara:strand:- start:232 stop:402 length:171 start_codon:yes stop_codon:yes gene_type:complete
MKNTNLIIWLGWLVLVIFWNYGYPEASPLLDVLVAILLSFLTLIVQKLLKVDYGKK